MRSYEQRREEIVDYAAAKIQDEVRAELADAWTTPTSTAAETLDMLAPVVARMLIVERFKPCTHEEI